MAKLTITQVKSSNGSSRKQNDTLRTLGLGKIDRARPHSRRAAPGEGPWLNSRLDFTR